MIEIPIIGIELERETTGFTWHRAMVALRGERGSWRGELRVFFRPNFLTRIGPEITYGEDGAGARRSTPG
jgi:hypothetical protein